MNETESANAPIERHTIRPGYDVSRIIKGGWQLSEGHSGRGVENAISDMHAFSAAGITTFDMADIYTGVEEMVGQFLQHVANTQGKEAEQHIQIHTKYVPDRSLLGRLPKGYTRQIIERSCERLGREYLDVVQFHWWEYGVPGFREAFAELAQLQQEGRIRHLGATNFNTPHIRELQQCGDLAVHQVQYSLLDRRPENGMVEQCRQGNTQLVCYGTVAGGFLSERYLGQSTPEQYENRSLEKYRIMIERNGGWEYFQELLKVLAAIAARHGVDIASVASRYTLQQPQVAAVIIGARNTTHLESHRRLFSFELDGHDLHAIGTILAQASPISGDPFDAERAPDSPESQIMKFDLNAK